MCNVSMVTVNTLYMCYLPVICQPFRYYYEENRGIGLLVCKTMLLIHMLYQPDLCDLCLLQAARKISKCAYLFVSPDLDFSNPLQRTKVRGKYEP